MGTTPATNKAREARGIKGAAMVLANIRAGKAPQAGRVARVLGYSESSIKAGIMQNTKAYQQHIQKENEKTAQALEVERARAIAQMKKKISGARYRDLVDGVDKFTKNHQLLTGGATENIGMRGSIVMLPSVEDNENEKPTS